MTSITNELRKYAHGYQIYVNHKLLEIADRIDVEHERVCYDYQREFEDWKFVHDTDFVELPKDADGEYIHIGDKVTLYDQRVYEVDAIYLHKDMVSVSYSGDSGCGCDSANNFHHYHAPTVEDVLQELVIDWDCATDGEDKTDVLKDYAKRLMLAGDDA